MQNDKITEDSRAYHEIEHGKYLAQGNTEAIWGWGTLAGLQRARKRGKAVAEAARLGIGISALEVGCGTGYFTKIFAGTGARITANDISPDLIALAQKQNPNVEFICAQFEELPQKPIYDAVIGSSVLHHLDLERALSSCITLLKPGGRFVFAEPNMLNPQVFAERTFMRHHLDYVSPDETAFVRWSLARTLKTLGFTDIHIRPFDWLHPAIPRSLIKPVEDVGGLLEKVPFVREFSGSLLISCRKPQ
jgi:2-polyprenyl-3-methyl-5-hydroxy-6-metoxy-1,4-benzoquinol methylase